MDDRTEGSTSESAIEKRVIQVHAKNTLDDTLLDKETNEKGNPRPYRFHMKSSLLSPLIPRVIFLGL